ncbi:MAG: Cys-tRNA(Pro)/Cys-tRNA(Cys) deacylase [Candidatus Azotimanducaceae bacterium]|jgi:Cys-tRNA(Pro)/Cys-tRNA(Cys) deacylase
MTPGIELVKNAGVFYIIHEYQHDATNTSFGLEALEKMGVDSKRIFKTLLVKSEKDELIVGIIPVLEQLSMKQIAKATASKKASMADKALVQRSTGYVLGGVSPLGQKRLHVTILDSSAIDHETIFVSAGRRGMEIELQAKDLILLTKGKLFDLIQQ